MVFLKSPRQPVFSSPLLEVTRWAFVTLCCPLSVPVCNLFIQTTSSLKQFIGFWPNFTGMIPGWSPTKGVETIPAGCIIGRSQGQNLCFQNAIFKNLLVWNYKTQSFHIWYLTSYRGPLPKLFKLCAKMADSGILHMHGLSELNIWSKSHENHSMNMRDLVQAQTSDLQVWPWPWSKLAFCTSSIARCVIITFVSRFMNPSKNVRDLKWTQTFDLNVWPWPWVKIPDLCLLHIVSVN